MSNLIAQNTNASADASADTSADASAKIKPVITIKSQSALTTEHVRKIVPIITVKQVPLVRCKEDKKCYCYVIISEKSGRIYIGKTNDLVKRLREHNGEISGGAKSIRGKGPFRYAFYVGGFHNKGQTLSFEWAMHHGGLGSRKYRPKPGLGGAIEALAKVTNRERWTGKCPLARTIPLTIYWDRDLCESVLKSKCFPAYVAHSFDMSASHPPQIHIHID